MGGIAFGRQYPASSPFGAQTRFPHEASHPFARAPRPLIPQLHMQAW